MSNPGQTTGLYVCVHCGSSSRDPHKPCLCEDQRTKAVEFFPDSKPLKRKTTIRPTDPHILAMADDLYTAAQNLYYLYLDQEGHRDNEYVQRLHELLKRIDRKIEGYGDEAE